MFKKYSLYCPFFSYYSFIQLTILEILVLILLIISSDTLMQFYTKLFGKILSN